LPGFFATRTVASVTRTSTAQQPVTTRSWEVRPATASDRDASLQLMQRAFGQLHPRAGERWDRMFASNPADPRFYFLVADAGERLAGQYAMMPLRLIHEGRRMKGLLSLDTATDPDFERQGIFTTLAGKLYADASEEFPIVFGFPSANSGPVLYKRLEWVELRRYYPLFACPLSGILGAAALSRPRFSRVARSLDKLLDPTLRILRLPSHAVRRIESLRGVEVQAVDGFGTWVDELWLALEPNIGTAVIRDSAMLEWRFASERGTYRRLVLMRAGRPAGLAVTRRTGLYAHLLELMVLPGDAAGAKFLIAHAILDAARDGAHALFTVFTACHPHRTTLLASGFLPVPHALRPRVSFGTRMNGPGVVPNTLFQFDSWYLDQIDIDVI
jgi:Acetyltransferase (GNAT) domain